ncbi:MAG: fatty acid desaturase [Solirubrobacterales bacterium]
MGAPTVHDIPIGLKGSLVDTDGTAYREFRATLQPRWWAIWAQVAGGYLLLAAIVAGLAVWGPGGFVALGAALGGGLALGYAIAYLNNFFHEAAHHNLAPNRTANDLLTNLLMSWLYGSSIALYRDIHWQHHRALGTTMDSENSYFDPLRVRYLVEGALGLKVVRTLLRYREMERSRSSSSSSSSDGRRRVGWMLAAAAVNGAIVGGLVLAGAFAAAAAWALGVLAFFPFFVSLRQTLEHRDEHADPAIDYTRVDHGATNRLFGDGPLASTLGSAGFNRHALHHWEPQVSCTRLGDLEGYLERTELEPFLTERRTSYLTTLRRLLEP